MKSIGLLLVLIFLSKIATPLQSQSLDTKKTYSLKNGYSLIIETTEVKVTLLTKLS